MSIQPGQTLGHYRFVERIGEGGMGVVWKALDTRLNREVAVKILPEVFAGDPERLERFSREARVLASLNHPNIAGIHGLEEQEGLRFLVMELVPGQDLMLRMKTGPVAVEDALEVARQIAEGLEAAHESGIIHRDLKPANIQITPDGNVKILDFGLAKALEPEVDTATGSLSPTLTTPATRAGVVLGTAAYMSPEQAKGKRVDRRTDIWAFGCVLYELLCGRRTFRGDGVSETLASVIMGSVDLDAVPAGAPAGVRALLERCLEKDPRRRLRDIGEARFILEEILAGRTGGVTAPQAGAGAPRARRSSFALVAAVAVMAAAAAALSVWVLRPSTPAQPLRRFEIPVEQVGRSSVVGLTLGISPDGSMVAYVDRGRLWIRPLDTLEAREVQVTREPDFLFWSPDSQWLGYAGGGRLWKAPAGGGNSTVITDQLASLGGGCGASWGVDDQILLAQGTDHLYEVSARGGDIKTFLEADPERDADLHEPHHLPGGRGVLFVSHRLKGRPDTLVLLAGGQRKDLLVLEEQTIWDPSYSPTGHILYRREPANQGIWALPFSLSRLEVVGEPFLVSVDGDMPSVSADGTLVHVKGSAARTTQMVWVDRKGEVVGEIGQPQEHWPFPALSPDGTRVAVAATENEERDLWIHDVERATMTRLTFDSERAATPFWSPDGTSITFSVGFTPPFDIFRKSADGSGDLERLGSGWDANLSPDGRFLLHTNMDEKGDFDLWYQDLEEGGEPVKLLAADGIQMWPRVSPDGRYVAYNSSESGPVQVYIRPFPEGAGKWQVSVDGGHWPQWSGDGRRIYFIKEDTMMEVEVSASPSLHLGRPRELFSREPLGYRVPFGWPAGFGLTSDAERFIFCQAVDKTAESGNIVVVENWVSEFEGAD